MPFIEERRVAQNLTNIAPVDQPDDPTLADTFAAAFRSENMIGSFLSSRGMPDPHEVEEGFNAIDYVKDDPEFSPYVDQFAGVFNKRAADAKKIQIKRELADQRTIDAAGGMGVVAAMAAGVLDIPTLLPVGGGALGAGVRGAALAAGVDAAVSEAGLQLTQTMRSGEQTAFNIGGSILLGGALGTLAGRYLSTKAQGELARKIQAQEKGFEEFDTAFAKASSAGAAARDTGPLTLKDEKLISRIPIANQQDPLIRLQLSDFDTARQTVRGLAETPLEYADNAAGVATELGGSVETRMKMWNAPLAESLSGIDTTYAKYFHNVAEPSAWQTRLSPVRSEVARMTGGQKLTYKQFKEEVGKAAFSDGKHAIPEVAEAAAHYRQIDEAMKKAAIEAKLFPEDVTVAGDVSHLFRMYNKNKIIAERGKFSQILNDYFIAGRNSAAFRTEENQIASKIVQADKVIERYNQSFERLSGLEERLSGRLDIRQKKLRGADEKKALRLDLLKERAPAGLVKMFRNSDENSNAIATVKEARALQRSAAKQKPYSDRYPVLSILKEKGGVRVGSPLDGELRAMGVTPKTHPGLFRKDGGIGAADNIVVSEHAALNDNLSPGLNGFADPNDLAEAIRGEVAGNPLRTLEERTMVENLEALSDNAEQWLDSVGLGRNATVKEVRDFINRVQAAEKNVDDLDMRIARAEQDIEAFDQVTDKLRNERDISAAEAATIADEITALEEALAEVSDIANASPRVSMMVDYATNARKLFKRKMAERNLQKRVDAIERIKADGKANDDMLLELAAKRMDLATSDAEIKKLHAKTEELRGKIPSASEIERTDEFANLSDAEIGSLVDETIDAIIGNAEGRIPYDSIVSGPRGPLKERLLKIESAKIQDFLELDIEDVLHAQVRTMSADVELAKKFGSVDLKEEIRKINDEANAKIAKATTPAERTRLDKQRKNAIRDVEGIRDRLRGQYALPANPDGLVLRAGRVARNLNYLRLLGGMTISAIPDMGKVVFTHGLTSTFRDGFIPMIRNFKGFRLAAKEVKQAGTALDMILDSRAMALADITGDFGRHSKFERGIKAMSSRFGVASLMAPWNASMKQFAGLVTMTNVLKASQRVANGTATEKDITRLAASSINEDLAKRIAAQFEKHGDEQDGILLAKAADWSDRSAREAFRAAVVRDVDRIVVTPGQDKPLWMSTELGKTIGQFKSFGISSMQRTALAGLQQRDAATLNGVMVMLGLGAMTYWAKQTIAGQPLSDNPAQWAVEAFDKSGLTGYLMEANNMSEKLTRGRVGFSALTGEQVSRYASRNVTGAFLGPTPDAIADIFQISGSIFAGDTTKADIRKARQLIPGQNLFYFRELFNQVEDATGEALGLPDTRK